MKVSLEQVRHVAALAQLELNPEELARMQKDLSAILAYVEQLNRLDAGAVAPMAQATPSEGGSPAGEDALRPDRERACFTQEQALANAPLAGGGCFKVPKVIATP